LIGLAPSHRIERRNGFGLSCFKFSGDSVNSTFHEELSKSINGRVGNHKHAGGYGSVVSVGFARQSWSSLNKLPEEEPLWLSLLRDIVCKKQVKEKIVKGAT
ncbi:hypothetical protein CARUB_v10006955mg, partial [Capsella rubella]